MRPAACREERSAMIWSAWTLLGLGTNYEISTLQVDGRQQRVHGRPLFYRWTSRRGLWQEPRGQHWRAIASMATFSRSPRSGALCTWAGPSRPRVVTSQTTSPSGMDHGFTVVRSRRRPGRRCASALFTAAGATASRIARWNGYKWESVGSGITTGSAVDATEERAIPLQVHSMSLLYYLVVYGHGHGT